MESGLELKILKKKALISRAENDLMLTDDLLNKYRFGCQILDDGLANIPCLGQLQNLIRAESLKLYTLFRAEGPKTIPYPYGGPKVSRHKQELHGTNENFTAQTRTSRHKRKLHGKNKNSHGTNKNSHGTNENSHGTNENFTAQTKTLTAEVNLTAEMAVYFTRAVTQSLKIWRNQ